jgi:hypothetical protein
LLSVQSHFPRIDPGLAETTPKITINKRNFIFFPDQLTQLLDPVVTLVFANQQGSGETIKFTFSGDLGGLLQS